MTGTEDSRANSSGSAGEDSLWSQKRRQRLQSVRRMAAAMDDQFTIPVLGIRVGWDSILGLVPGVGDFTTLATHAYIMWKGYQLGVGPFVQLRMLANALIDFLVGSIPFLGDLFDLFWRANRRNAELLARVVEQRDRAARRAEPRVLDRR